MPDPRTGVEEVSVPKRERKVHITVQRRAICEAIRDGHNWGTGIIAETGVSMPVVYSTLARLREVGWVTRELEATAVAFAQRRSERHLYSLTDKARDALGWLE
jgi:DNA-binding PadR family transcriptional regulator